MILEREREETKRVILTLKKKDFEKLDKMARSLNIHTGRICLEAILNFFELNPSIVLKGDKYTDKKK